MGQLRCILLCITLLVGVSVTSYAQKDGKGPPAPTEKRHKGPPCDPGNGNGNGVPPPPGLCLPIDDYVYILMAVGLMYGCYKLRDFGNAKTAQ
ncbi:hypothetical protein C8P64_0978 [Christiangramia gaetbulicola]|uniref:Uncharacterized protein n=1 Tax=Christiangramia gaetbulicola TaxID=703340 RepID=A0A2T6AMG3_9FLAO|nr:hypothetical protein [Christiangramia gaetbulicola]PTX44990.1 hypothetical protein C8P64_0978 [Christiangramia gaetbulicola]